MLQCLAWLGLAGLKLGARRKSERVVCERKDGIQGELKLNALGRRMECVLADLTGNEENSR